MKSRRTMHGKRRKRSSCLKKTRQVIDGYFGGDIKPAPTQNYAPTESEKYNPMDQAANRLEDKDMNIERDKS